LQKKLMDLHGGLKKINWYRWTSKKIDQKEKI
jgi:hypothetical protein